MKHLSIFESTSKELVETFATKGNITDYVSKNYTYPREDYLLASNELPIFVVADGVTLNFKKLIEDNVEYPNPSPAGEVAQIFCEAVQKSAKEKLSNFTEADIKTVFKDANSEVASYNGKIGQSNISGNQTGFYSATGAFVVIKDDAAYWASICDAFFAHFDKNMNLKFMSTGVCVPYAVINGEERMAEHIENGVIQLEKGDRIFVFTDGFEHYVKNPNFLEFFKDEQSNLKNNIDTFSQKMIAEDFERYGHERSLIAVFIES